MAGHNCIEPCCFLFDLFLNTFQTRSYYLINFTIASVLDYIFRFLQVVFEKEGGKEKRSSHLPNHAQYWHYFPAVTIFFSLLLFPSVYKMLKEMSKDNDQ